ncbi:pyridoxamine 5'-phosphate oxidase family protein [Erwinia sorbitola]|uniref:Pyridoxamine 5'-phosphate oxidase n=1 Tax=Erwinia sorbitola TaxID=2681984 RepID=A0A6I6EC86_9GAMM|nr:pyridoxamine 5'-phosphate oxidase family protein [Erwinia sorbitola]QGU87407.1 pyridoxamine 5'-phosphate oxidase [Erwinia sorbitola]
MFHSGEQQAQQKAGYQQVRAALYTTMPEQHRLFYQGLETFYLSVLDHDGWPVAALIQGASGFIASPNETQLTLPQDALEAVPYLPALKAGMAVGGLGIDFSNRRRNRVNGVVEGVSDGRLQLHVQESFGNCPQYIQRRNLAQHNSRRRLQIESLNSLDADARYLISAADTLFVASHAPRQGSTGGADISHRGGMPGFIILKGGKLWIPDYTGNRYMNTLGNLLLEPRCALLIMDFHQGAALHIQGRAEILWQMPGEGRTERFWTVEPQRILRLRQLLPAAGTDVEYADSTLAAGQ